MQPTRVFARPDATSSAWAQLRPGLPVAALRTIGDWVQVEYAVVSTQAHWLAHARTALGYRFG